MKEQLTVARVNQSNRINRVAYALYLILVIYLAIKGDFEWAIVNLGIALVFDPFDATVTWRERPFYQKAWLLVHVGLVFAGFIFLCFQNQ